MTVTGQRSNAHRSNPYADVQVELTSLCFHGLMSTVASSGIIILLVTYVLAIHYHSSWFLRLMAILPIPWTARLVIIYLFRVDKVSEMAAQTAERWEIAYGWATLIYVVGAAAVTISTRHQRDVVGLILVTLGTFAYANGISSRLSLRPWIAKFSGLVMFLGLGVALMGSEQRIIRCSVVLLALYAYFYCDSIQSKYDILVEQLRLKRQLRELAEHDALTGLPNRRRFEASLARICAQPRQEPSTFAVFFLDLDGFKKINDTYGHAAGDTLLQLVAQRLQNVVRSSDLVARLGGDEFAVLHTPEATVVSAQALARRILDTVSAPFAINGQQLWIGTSIGIKLPGATGRDPNRLLSEADAALYDVKQSGKGSFSFADHGEAARLAEAQTHSSLIN